MRARCGQGAPHCFSSAYVVPIVLVIALVLVAATIMILRGYARADVFCWDNSAHRKLGQQPQQRALEILHERYARGKIKAEEYRQMKLEIAKA